MKSIKARWLTYMMCRKGKFDAEQRYQIYTGFRWYELTVEQVSVYAKATMSAEQMRTCKHALAKEFSIPEMKEWIGLGLSEYKFKSIIEARLNGISKELIMDCAQKESSDEEFFYEYIQLSL